MPGGLIQLASGVGSHMDYYTSGNPDIVFFKSVYRKFNHFAQELIELTSDNTDNSLRSASDVITLKYKIPRNGNLVNRLFMEFELPAIYSDATSGFQWIRRIGEYVIQEARIVSDNNFIFQRLTPEYIQIFNETHLAEGAKSAYYDNIGHIPEMYEPDSITGTYPDYSGETAPYDTKPSIPKKRIILPLPFWFTTNSGCALPLVAMQYMTLRIEIDIKPVVQLYTVIDTDGYRVRPSASDTTQKMSAFTSTTSDATLSNVEVRLYGNYIFLEDDLQKYFALNSHSYLMRQIQVLTEDTTSRVGGTYNVDLKNINFPITQFFFMLRRKDNSISNQWSNFTLWEYEAATLKNPADPNFTSQYNNTFVGGTYSEDMDNPHIITDTELYLNGNPFYKVLPIEFFTVNRFMNNKNDGCNDEMAGIYNFSFSLDNDKYQPSGLCNFSTLDRKFMQLTFSDITSMVRNSTPTPPYTFNSEYEIIFLFENMNIVEFQGGMAGVKFVN